MSRLLLAVLVALVLALPAHAQTETPPPEPDYRIYVINAPTLEGNMISVEFGILNIGGDAELEATVVLVNMTTNEQLGITSIPPLASQGVETVRFTFPITGLPPNSLQSIQASVGIGEIEPLTGSNIGNNTARTSFSVPADVPAAAEAEATETPGSDGGGGAPRFRIPLLDTEVNLNNPLHVGILLGVAGVALVLLWVATIILRLLFNKPQALNAWQPPYASMSMLDPNSAAGRRQLWQPHAHNDALITPCSEGTYHIRKLLMGIDNTNLSGWRVTALRLSQYDMYGRVARSHTLAPNGLVRRLNRAAHKAASADDEEKAMQAARPLARSLVKQFSRKLSKRNAMLPIALDVRFRGTHGEVRILFELFGCVRGQWQLIDHWEPDMIVMQNAIHENFTYTMFGQYPNEDFKTFRERITDELTRILAEMMTRKRVTPPAPVVGAVEMPPIERYIPQDTSPHPPMGV